MTSLLDFDREKRQDGLTIAGLDEAGRGPLAGPVVAAIVVLPEGLDLPEINDSKQIKKKDHRRLVDLIMEKAIEVRVGVVDAKRIDEINILQADKEAMLSAVNQCITKLDLLLIDGNKSQTLNTNIKQETIVKGDSKSLSIAAASLVAKHVRDVLMLEYDKEYPEYGFKTNSGYGTKQHFEAIDKYGPTPIHRMTFKPLRKD